MKVFLLAAVVLAIAVFGMCVSIIFRKNGHFPEYEVSSNREMRRLGIKCFREQDDEMFGAKGKKQAVCSGEYTEACKGCGLYKKEKK